MNCLYDSSERRTVVRNPGLPQRIRALGRATNRVALFNPCPDSAESASAAACYPPLGLISIATVVERLCPEAEIRIFDLNVDDGLSYASFLEGGTVVGISTLTTTYRSSLEIAKTAWEHGCYIVMGNDHASRFSERIVRSRCVDAVLVGDNVEYHFARLILFLRGLGGDLRDMPCVVYLDGNKVIRNEVLYTPMEALPIANRALLNHGPYMDNFEKKFSRVLGYERNTRIPTTINMCRGCSKFKSRCYFCDIFDLHLERLAVARAWKELSLLADLGLNYIWEVGDSFTSHPKWIKEMARSRPDNVSLELFVYARAQELVRSELVLDLKELGVTRVNIGMESGSDKVLAYLRKGNRRGNNTNLEAAYNLSQAGLKAHVSVILGSREETEGTLRQTVDLIESLLRLGILTSLDPSILYPLPGAPLWGDLVGSPEFKDSVETDLLPVDLRERYNRVFCKVSIEELEAVRISLNRLASEYGAVPGGFG